jgi:exosome complex RNA-binding protein Rrp42 (RNase PH superfamily)
VIVSDPNHQEESVMSGKMVLGVNPYREICTLHLAGQMLIDKVKLSLGFLFWLYLGI